MILIQSNCDLFKVSKSYSITSRKLSRIASITYMKFKVLYCMTLVWNISQGDLEDTQHYIPFL